MNEFNIKNGFISNGNSSVNGKLTTQNLQITSGATNGYVLTSDASGNAIWSAPASSLVNITETGSTITPNNVVPVVGLKATSGTTNVDFAILPKGTGAFILRIPDNTGVGGNKRGQYAVDLSIAPSFGAYNVASGDYSSIAGGVHNLASNTFSVNSGGYYNTSSGYGSNVGGGVQNQSTSTHSSVMGGSYNNATGSRSSIAGGSSNSATGYAAFVPGGYGNSATNNYTFAIGNGNISSADSSGSVGHDNISNGTRSYAFGTHANTFGVFRRHSFSSGQFASQGDNQMSNFLMKVVTTNNVATSLTTDGFGYSNGSNNYILLSNQSAYRFKGSIIGIQSGSTNTVAWDVDGLIVRGANASTTTLIVGNVNVVDNTPIWGTPTITADTTIGCLNIQVTGVASTNIRWVAKIETTEVIYA